MPMLDIKDKRGQVGSFGMDEKRCVVGRGSECDIVLHDNQVSRRHAEITYRDGSYWIKDLGSTNQTFVNGNAVTEAQLSIGDTIRVGDHVLALLDDDGFETQQDVGDMTMAFMRPSASKPLDYASARELELVETINKKITAEPTLERMVDLSFLERASPGTFPEAAFGKLSSREGRGLSATSKSTSQRIRKAARRSSSSRRASVQI